MDERLERIQDFLITQNASTDTITKGRLLQLEKVDEVIQIKQKAISEAKEILKTMTINVSSIAAATGISRKTFYNNNLLKMYVEKYATVDSKSVLANEYEHIKAKNEELSSQVHAFVIRDIESENLRHENMKLQQEVKNLCTRIRNLEMQNEKAQKELSELKKCRAEKPGHIIPISLK